MSSSHSATGRISHGENSQLSDCRSSASGKNVSASRVRLRATTAAALKPPPFRSTTRSPNARLPGVIPPHAISKQTKYALRTTKATNVRAATVASPATPPSSQYTSIASRSSSPAAISVMTKSAANAEARSASSAISTRSGTPSGVTSIRTRRPLRAIGTSVFGAGTALTSALRAR